MNPNDLNLFLRFFYDKEFASLKGLLGTLLQLAGVIGALLAARVLLTRPPLVARNLDAVGCLDLAQFHESYTQRGLHFPESLKQDLAGLVPQAPKPVPEANPAWPYSAMPHYILCWYQPPRTAERLKEIEQERSQRSSAAGWRGLAERSRERGLYAASTFWSERRHTVSQSSDRASFQRVGDSHAATVSTPCFLAVATIVTPRFQKIVSNVAPG